ncbi:endonuclease/exonuclease/phosphatase family protein [Sphaerisporangium viridialbum]|uniref:endonuclease/exonuclease/phosphatase family protein n=1 Tax=Sphaerisporangium viridialbum TaxID=46189 RepID=UPI003C711E68
MSVPRRAGLVALGILALWAAFTLANWLTGRFWWWGGAAPLVVFFAAPLAVLWAVAVLLLARARLSRLERALVGLAAAEAALVVLHRLLSGRTWVWVIPDLMVPPLLFALLPVALVAAVGVLALSRARVAGRARWWTALLASAALVLGLDQAGLRAPWGGGLDGPVPPGALRVVSWDTFCWDTTDDPARFLRYLKKWSADVYLLQEHSGCGPGAPTPIDDGAQLRREFPSRYFATADGLLTISRFPIVRDLALGTVPNPVATNWRRAALRTDLRVGGRVLSVYNVHLYDMLYLSSSPLTGDFYRSMRLLDAARATQLRELVTDVDGNANPVLASGNFNLLPGMGYTRRLGHLNDAARAGGPLYPATLTFAGLRLWRMDWTFTSPGVDVHRYALRSPEGLSSHHLQDMAVSLAANENAAASTPPNPKPKVR